jgi:hypothetical protein
MAQRESHVIDSLNEWCVLKRLVQRMGSSLIVYGARASLYVGKNGRGNIRAGPVRIRYGQNFRFL